MKNIVKTALISLSVFLITLFVCSFKHNLFIDEMISFGLANNEYITRANDYTSYSGDELLLDFAAVKKGEEFNFKNLIENQKNDTHPPFWYMLINIVCSLNAGKWSIWYGLIINILITVVAFWAFRWIYEKLLENEKYATIFSYLTIVTNAIITSYVFIRMYALLALISLLYFIVAIKEMFYRSDTSKTSKLFYLCLYVLTVIGTLTHYHFLLVGGLIGIILCIYLIFTKQYKKLAITVGVSVLGLVTAYMLFPYIINHLFFSSELHSVGVRESTEISQNASNFFKYIFNNVFSYSIFIYIFVILFLIIGNALKHKSVNKKQNLNENKKTKFDFSNPKVCIYLIMGLVLVIYYVVLLVTIKFSGERYLYNWFAFFVIFVYSGIYNISKLHIKYYKVFALILIVISVLWTKIVPPRALYVDDDKITKFYTENADKKMLVCYDGKRKWDTANIFYIFRNVKDVTIVNASVPEFQRYGNFVNNTEFFVTILEGLNDNQVLNSVASVNDVDSYEEQLNYYSRYKIYRLFNSNKK